MFLQAPVRVLADIEETQKQLDLAREAAQQTEDAIGQNQGTIDALTGTQNDLQGQLNAFNAKLTDITSRINELDGEIDDKVSEIEDTEEMLDRTQEELEEAIRIQESQYAAMKKRVQFLYEKGNSYLVEILLGSSSFSEMLNRRSYISSLSAYDKKMLEKYVETRKDVEEKKADLEEQKRLLEEEHEQLRDLHAEQSGHQDEMSALVASTAGSLNLTGSQIRDAQAVADALATQLDQQNSQISELEKKLAEEKRLQALSDASTWRNLSEVEFAEGDRYLLANLIYCEAGGEPYIGQVAVGAVVMNRVMSGAFPGTVSGVIYQSWQFEPAATGRLAIALAADQATESCYAAADAAMQGQTPVATCLFFRTPIPEVEPKYVIGGHIFY